VQPHDRIVRPGGNASVKRLTLHMCSLIWSKPGARFCPRTIEPTGGPGAELATLGEAARFVGLMRPWRQARPHWDFAAELLLKAAKTRAEDDVEAATAQMERTLRVEGRL
jgi:hypothetical protein